MRLLERLSGLMTAKTLRTGIVVIPVVISAMHTGLRRRRRWWLSMRSVIGMDGLSFFCPELSDNGVFMQLK